MYLYQDDLESDRLYTKFLSSDVIECWLPFFESEKATKLFPDFGVDSPAEKAKYWFNLQLDRYASNRYGLQGIYRKEDNLLIGQSGLLLQEVDGILELEVGYHFLPLYWGKGYAPEAAEIFINYAKENQLAESIISIIDIRNSNSIRVAEKNGLTLDKSTTWKDLNVHIFRKRMIPL